MLLSACQPETAPQSVLAGMPDRAGWLPEYYSVSPRSAVVPREDAGAIVFQVNRGRCSAHRDATGPSDCATGSVRSALTGGSIHRLGHQYLHSFEVFVPADFARGGGSARLAIARWQGADGARRGLFDLSLDARRGITFRGQTCVSPAGFGTWQRIFVRLRWAADATGFLEVRCGGPDIYAARPVFFATGIATARPPECWRAGACGPGQGLAAQRFEFQIGLIHDGRGAGRLPAEGVTLRLRRIAERRLFVILGLDTGP